MSNKVVLMKERRSPGGYYYLLSSMSGGEWFDLLVGATLISAAPFFYSVVTADILSFAVFMTCATAATALGVRNFVHAPDPFPRRPAPASRVRRMPSAARREWEDAA